jgi:hypothetical protein
LGEKERERGGAAMTKAGWYLDPAGAAGSATATAAAGPERFRRPRLNRRHDSGLHRNGRRPQAVIAPPPAPAKHRPGDWPRPVTGNAKEAMPTEDDEEAD